VRVEVEGCTEHRAHLGAQALRCTHALLEVYIIVIYTNITVL